MINSSLFLKPSIIEAPLNWVGHIPFAFWIIEALRPNLFVELGTHSGNSYFAFCQSIANNSLHTQCYAVDTWKGEIHAGYYGEEVFTLVNNHNAKLYQPFSSLLRMTFDEAVERFTDCSIDLLHIDGLHTYDAVRHDFESWLPKMSEHGVVLFHDIAERNRDFGVWKLWDELSSRYPSISFLHSHGLGVLFTGKAIAPGANKLLELWHSETERSLIRQLFSSYGEALITEYQHKRLLEQRTHLQTSLDASMRHNCELDRNRIEQHNNIVILNKTIEGLRQEYNDVVSSRTWRITKPLRKLPRSVKKRVQKIKARVKGFSWKPEIKDEYGKWLESFDIVSEEQRERMLHDISEMKDPPLISIIMPVYNPPLRFLEDAIKSVLGQIYPFWELCIADDRSPNKAVRQLILKHAKQDPRIKYVFRNENGHISEASNSAINLASGEFLALLDHDDTLHNLALFHAAKCIIEHPEVDLIYSDEDKINESGRRFSPYFKCDFNYDLFLNQNLISHLGIYRTSIVKEIGGFRKGFEGSQDYDLALRTIERIPHDRIHHIPKVLYHWRTHKNSTARNIEAKPYAYKAATKAVEAHLQRMNVDAVVEGAPKADGMLRIRYAIGMNPPSVEIVILTRDKADLLKTCIDSIIEKTTYPNYTITVVDNGSQEQEAFELFDSLKQNPAISIYRDDIPFNYSKLNNNAISRSSADFVCLMNNDIEVITPAWLEEMMGHAMQSDVGAVGARLLYPDNTLQHAGVIMGMGGVAGHAHKNIEENNPGYFGRAVLQQSFSAVTAACLLVARSKFQAVNGLNEEDLQVAFNDVDFCLKLRVAGYRNVWTPYAELYHHESLSRGYEDTPEKQERFLKEIYYMKKTWERIINVDPAYSPNLTLDLSAQYFALSWPPRVSLNAGE